ncbi:MAG: bifunctional riboflavin kinase/FAD synthetase [Corynebacterium sp.]|nr:bifunctional riboflavin kinase/FAD synthetase [Corynebacterium sp.]
MKIWNSLDQVPAFDATVVSIGVFDGIHRGHRTLIAEATQKARQYGIPSIILTFNPHPLAVLRPEHMPPMLGSVAQRCDLATQVGIDHMLALNFTADLARLSPEEFFQHILVEKLHARTVVVGENFTFGYKAAGTTEVLRQLGEKYGVEIIVMELLAEDGTVLSSTVVRDCLHNGNIRHANSILGREYSVTGEITRGAGRGGRELGFPTANQYFPDTVALPTDGVYAGWFTVVSQAPIEGDMQPQVCYPAAISVGHNPTFGDERRSVESYILGRSADLYGHTATVEFVDHVREIKKFSSIPELLRAIEADVAKVEEILGISSKG